MTVVYRTVKEVADLLKVGDPTVRRWINNGELRAIDIGRGWRIADEDLRHFIEEHANRPQHQADATSRTVQRYGPEGPG